MLPVFTTAQGAYLPSLLLPGERRRERGERDQREKRRGLKDGQRWSWRAARRGGREEMGIVAGISRGGGLKESDSGR